MRNSKWWIVISIVLIALGTALIISAIILVQSAASNPELATKIYWTAVIEMLTGVFLGALAILSFRDYLG